MYAGVELAGIVYVFCIFDLKSFKFKATMPSGRKKCQNMIDFIEASRCGPFEMY